jgi:hypothetical protein
MEYTKNKCTPVSKILKMVKAKNGQPDSSGPSAKQLSEKDSKNPKSRNPEGSKKDSRNPNDPGETDLINEAETIISDSKNPEEKTDKSADNATDKKTEHLESEKTAGIAYKKYIIWTVVVVISFMFTNSAIFKKLIRKSVGDSFFMENDQNQLNVKGRIVQGLFVASTFVASKFILGKFSKIIE